MNALSDPWLPEPAQSQKPLLSVVIPVYNERPVLPLLYERLRAVLDALDGIRHELVLVDDGSRDGSGDYLAGLAARTPRVKAVRLSRNFGKEAALTAGLAQARGDAVVILDADLQDPPELIPQMLDAWRAGADVVCMRRRSRAGETWFKRGSAHLFYRLLNRISDVDIPEDTGDFRLLSRQAVDALEQLGERKRYMKGLFAWIGLPTRVIEYDRAPRAAGASKWDYLGLLGLAFEGITSFSVAPLRLTMGAGIVTALAGILYGLWIVAKTLVLGDPVQGYPSLISVMTFLGGIQLISIGLLGEYVGKTYFEAKQRPVYLIRDVVQARAKSKLHAASN
ncbi:glycosyltransferase family 2 protein [Pollutimonas bauzanensis]|uniref:Glycosyltransferase involved in cell wall bisynthesis n=1 Tax=Pollutimonas bauzanensis TaxID=658167 RepID=A0A1M5WB93_9BURK|nr:glycosyltransferase family 2 protein [Pollutimonas bauzanensis]SHH84720.1 Glycosyltransferase involved in cell wall bisynthesis [Pollutimonas bauzanensis]